MAEEEKQGDCCAGVWKAVWMKRREVWAGELEDGSVSQAVDGARLVLGMPALRMHILLSDGQMGRRNEGIGRIESMGDA